MANIETFYKRHWKNNHPYKFTTISSTYSGQKVCILQLLRAECIIAYTEGRKYLMY